MTTDKGSAEGSLPDEPRSLTPRPTYLTTRAATSSYWSHTLDRTNSTHLDDYFQGPRDPHKHSKWPFFLRLHGSVLPAMIVPLLFVGAWSTCITCISKFFYELSVYYLLLTVLGFVVGLSLSFRNSTAYERYSEGRKYWASLNLVARNLGRIIWINVQEREGEEAKDDILAKLTAMNLITAFALALKHKLRFEPYADYEDMNGILDHLDTYASAVPSVSSSKKSTWKAAGEYLGIPFAHSNPRKAIKKATAPLGNLPLEIMNYLAAYIEEVISNSSLKDPAIKSQVMVYLATMNDVATGTERVLNTPLPLAYTIAISQITWVYVLILPFQLYEKLGWITIPASMVSAYIILGLAAIGRELENPFGNDVNDLPLDIYCEQIASDLDIISSKPPPRPDNFVRSSENRVLFPLSMSGYSTWVDRSVGEIREALQAKVVVATTARVSFANDEQGSTLIERKRSAPVKPQHHYGDDGDAV
ncbi:MAG: hypothetical protein M1834_008484 [Cirrosporium novae-zelandiae]|nr:MAG: hypothetical protein M1834_008484 [Cirrosporium novae-zelandiae]